MEYRVWEVFCCKRSPRKTVKLCSWVVSEIEPDKTVAELVLLHVGS